jgi:hypothetical protein
MSSAYKYLSLLPFLRQPHPRGAAALRIVLAATCFMGARAIASADDACVPSGTTLTCELSVGRGDR